MPLYNFTCRDCNVTHEHLVPRNRKTLRCVACEGVMDRQFPHRFALVTDTTRTAGRGTLMEQFSGNEEQVGDLVRAARQNGYEPGINDIYEPGLANRPGDPAAFIKSGDYEHHVRKVCTARGTGCNGPVKVKTPEPAEPTKKPRLSPKIVDRHAKRALAHSPELRAKLKSKGKHGIHELRESIVDKHGSQE